MIVIRPATLDDVQSIVDIHITSWKAHFIPFLTAEQVKLKMLDEARQFQIWQERLATEEGITRFTCLAERDNQPIAYITGRNTVYPDEAELQQIYVLPSAHRQGIGKQLVSRLAQVYQQQGRVSLFVWVMTINPAVGFYRDHLGAEYCEERLIPHGDGVLKEARYRWQLEDLLA